MKYSMAVWALAASVVSAWSNDTIVYTTEIVDVYTTVCPASGTITFNGHTYTNTLTKVSCSLELRAVASHLSAPPLPPQSVETDSENPQSSTITITNCPCTVTKPVGKPSPSTKPVIVKPSPSTKSVIVKPSPSTKPVIVKPSPSTKSVVETQSTILYSSCASSTTSGAPAPLKTITPAGTTYTNPLTAVYSTGAIAPTTTPIPFVGAASANHVGGVAVAAIAGVVALML